MSSLPIPDPGFKTLGMNGPVLSTLDSDGNIVPVGEGGIDFSIYENNGQLLGNRVVDLNGKTLNFNASGEYVAEPFKIEGFPVGGGATNPYFKIKGYGEVEILGTLSDLLTVKNTSGNIIFDVNNGSAQVNGNLIVSSSLFKVQTTPQAMKFYQSGGTTLIHDIQTNGGGLPIRTIFNAIGGGTEFIVGSSAVIGTEDISLQGNTLISKKLELSSKEHGVLLNRVDDTEMAAITGMVENEIVYNTDINALYRWDGANWVLLFDDSNDIDVDYGNTIFVSEVGGSGDLRADIIGDINKPVSLEWASSIAQSGDTIHVKSGVYNITTTNVNGLCVDGVNHFFEPNSKVYKNTSGPIFNKSTLFTECNVYGSGSFYGSGSCGNIFENNGSEGSGYTQIYEYDICENSSTGCLISTSNENINLKGKRSIVSSGGVTITITDNSVTDKTKISIECPLIESTVAQGILHSSASGTSGVPKLTINADDIIGASETLCGLDLNNNPDGLLCTVRANYINYVLNSTDTNSLNKNITFDVNRIDRITNFNGKHLKVNGHLGYLTGSHKGIIDISLVDRCIAVGTAIVNATINGDFDYTSDVVNDNLVITFAGNNILNFRLQKSNRTGGPFQYEFVEGWFISFAGGTLNMLGNWDIQDFWITLSGGRLNIPSGTVINIGPKRTSVTNSVYGETFYLAGVDVNIGGTIVERCDTSASCDTSQPSQIYSNTFMYVDNWTSSPESSSRIIYNGAIIVVRDQNSQILTTGTSGGYIGIYSGGLNTNKMNSFSAEKEKIRVMIDGTGASYTIGSETITSTGLTPADCALELVTLTNNNTNIDILATQDDDGVDEYLYLESEVSGEPIVITYDNNTSFGVTIRQNTKAISDVVGGTLIEDANIIKDQYN